MLLMAEKAGHMMALVNQFSVQIADGNIIKEHPSYEFIWTLAFSPDGRFVVYGAKSGQELWWRVEAVE